MARLLAAPPAHSPTLPTHTEHLKLRLPGLRLVNHTYLLPPTGPHHPPTQGGTLQDVILQAMSNQRQYTTEMALSWLHDVAEALTALHTHGSEVIIHRDVKSDNVLLTGSSSSTTTASARNSAKGHGAGGGLGGGSSKKLVGGLRGGAVSGSCSGWAAARTTAKLADLGLHVVST